MQYIKVWLLTIAFIALSLQAAGWNEVERYDLPGYDGSEHFSLYEYEYDKGVFHIAYYDAVSSDLKYATNASGNWVVETVDSTGDVWMYPSVETFRDRSLGANGIHISYYDATNGDLKVGFQRL